MGVVKLSIKTREVLTGQLKLFFGGGKDVTVLIAHLLLQTYEIEIEIVYNMSRQTGPVVVSRATLLRHT
jgi:hypothetical protein